MDILKKITLISTNESNEKLKINEEIWSKIKDQEIITKMIMMENI